MSPSFTAEPAAAKPAPKPGPAWGAEEVQPTPENLVYFRWSLGHFPGAQPPLGFWDGTSTTRKVEYPDRHDPKIMRKKMIPDFADTKSKNIQWKARVPGWGLFIEQYHKDLDPFRSVGCYAGAASNLMRMGGMVPAGKRLLIQTPAFLYCMGEK